MQPAVPEVEHHRPSPRAMKTFCLPTIGVSRLLLFLQVLVFDMFAVMFGSFIGLKYPSLQCTLEISSSKYRLGAEPLKSEAPVNREKNRIYRETQVEARA